VIPDIEWLDEASFDFVFLGLPVGMDCVAVQAQTILVNENERQGRLDGIARICDVLKPKQMLACGASGPDGDTKEETAEQWNKRA
jgi:hypothetical protein